MFMPYIEGPKMNWTVDDGLYHRFLKWHLKCENHSGLQTGKPSCQAKMPKSNKDGQVTLGWISMYPGAYLKKSSHWMPYGPNLRNSQSLKQMKWELILIY